MKTVLQLDEAGYFQGTTKADPDPLQPGKYLIPGGCIDVQAPTLTADQRARWNGAAWAIEAKPQPPAEPAPPTAQEIRRGQIAARLDAIDRESIRALRAATVEQSNGRPVPAFERSKLAALETEAATLRTELATL